MSMKPEVRARLRAEMLPLIEAWRTSGETRRVFAARLGISLESPRLLKPTSVRFTADEAETIGEIESTTVVATLAVSANGCVESVEVVRGPSGKVRDIITERLRAAVFFPASKGRTRVAATSTVRLNVEVS